MEGKFEIRKIEGDLVLFAKYGESLILGRSPMTMIKDVHVSRQHLRIHFADEIKFTQLGVNPSRVNGVTLDKGKSHSISGGDVRFYLHNGDRHGFSLSYLPSTRNGSGPFRTPWLNLKRRQDNAVESGHAHNPAKRAKPSLQSWLGKNEAMADVEWRWEDIPSEKLMVLIPSNAIGQSQVVGFDVDGTIITTKSGKTFGVDYDDWKILFPNCAVKLKSEIASGKKVVFFTNQAGIEKGKVDRAKFRSKIEAVLTALGVSVQVFVSCGDGYNRKPLPGMWEYLEKRANSFINVDRSRCLYVGDAAGRPENWRPKTKKDFSCGDRLFALNLGVSFQTPEEYFQGSAAPPFSLPEFDPRSLRGNAHLTSSTDAAIDSPVQEVVVLVGPPAAGKTTFVKNHLLPHGYIHVNRDSLGSWQQCVEVTDEALRSGKSVAVDNTNVDAASRERYLAVARKNNVKVRCFLFDVSVSMSKHLNKYRRFVDLDKAHKDVNEIVIFSHRKKFQAPKVSEGFEEILNINFVPKFKNEKEEKLFFSFLIEK